MRPVYSIRDSPHKTGTGRMKMAVHRGYVNGCTAHGRLVYHDKLAHGRRVLAEVGRQVRLAHLIVLGRERLRRLPGPETAVLRG